MTITNLKIIETVPSLARNLQKLLKERGLAESDLANALNIPVMTVRRVVSGETADPRISTLKLFADFFHVTIDSLVNGFTALTHQKIPVFVPVLDWITAAEMHSLSKIDLTQWKEWHPVVLPDQQQTNNIFALKTRKSMQPRFPIDTLLIISSDEAPTDGDIVLVKLQKEKELSLRELVIDPPKWQLKPVTPGSETLYYDKNHQTIIGTVILTLFYAKTENQI